MFALRAELEKRQKTTEKKANKPKQSRGVMVHARPFGKNLSSLTSLSTRATEKRATTTAD
jgi:hypothetical protein